MFVHHIKHIKYQLLWRRYININSTILDITHRPVFHLKSTFSETGFCPRLQVVTTQLAPMDKGNTVTGSPLPWLPYAVGSTWQNSMHTLEVL
jgi:hypothetical protein